MIPYVTGPVATRLRELEASATRMSPLIGYLPEPRIYRPAPTVERPAEYERPSGYTSTQLLQAGGAAASLGGPNMADAQTISTLRAEGGFIIPEQFKKFLPLILLFLLFALVIFKK